MMSNLGPFQTGFRVQSSEFSFSCRFEVISSRIFWTSSTRKSEPALYSFVTKVLQLSRVQRSKDRLVSRRGR